MVAAGVRSKDGDPAEITIFGIRVVKLFRAAE